MRGDTDLRFVGGRAELARLPRVRIPHTRKIFGRHRWKRCPHLHFGTGTRNILQDLRDAGGDVRRRLAHSVDEAWDRIGHARAIQGNLDRLFCSRRSIACSRRQTMCSSAPRAAGHIFNLGHGILPSTPVEHVQALAQHVHRYRLAHA